MIELLSSDNTYTLALALLLALSFATVYSLPHFFEMRRVANKQRLHYGYVMASTSKDVNRLQRILIAKVLVALFLLYVLLK